MATDTHADTGARTQARGRVRVEDGFKRVRAVLGGTAVADSRHVKLVWEKPWAPTYYFPVADVRADLLAETGGSDHSPSRGDAKLFTVRVGDREADGAAARLDDSPIDALRGTVKFDWDAMDAWFEEDEEVYAHPRDPYHRVDVLQSSRHVRVEVDGVTVAESTQPRLLFETGLPVRYYLPKTDVRLDLLTRTATSSKCPYKGTAEYYSVQAGGTTHDDIVWWYRYPLPESVKIAGYVSFYNEKVDLYVDGELQERPSR